MSSIDTIADEDFKSFLAGYLGAHKIKADEDAVNKFVSVIGCNFKLANMFVSECVEHHKNHDLKGTFLYVIDVDYIVASVTTKADEMKKDLNVHPTAFNMYKLMEQLKAAKNELLPREGECWEHSQLTDYLIEKNYLRETKNSKGETWFTWHSRFAKSAFAVLDVKGLRKAEVPKP